VGIAADLCRDECFKSGAVVGDEIAVVWIRRKVRGLGGVNLAVIENHIVFGEEGVEVPRTVGSERREVTTEGVAVIGVSAQETALEPVGP